MQNICRILQLTNISIMAVERDKSRREGILLRMSTRDSVPLSENTKIIIQWTMIVLCMWSSFCALSDNALDILLAFLKALFESLEILFPVLASFAVLFLNH